MLRTAIETGFIRTLARRADGPAFPLVAAGVALAEGLKQRVTAVDVASA